MRARAASGLIGALLLLASSALHGVGGWRFMSAQLDRTGAPAELQLGLQLGWMLGSAAMLAFGLIVAIGCVRRWRGLHADAWPLATIAVVYGAYGAWALAITGFEPQFLIFVIPAVLIAIAAPGPRRR